MRTYNKEQKEKEIKRELSKLKRVLKNIPEQKKKISEGLMQEAAFMRVTLKETREIIDREGVLELFEQGKQSFAREHPATKVYNTMINRYSAVCKQLFDLIPDAEAAKKAEDELVAFLKKVK